MPGERTYSMLIPYADWAPTSFDCRGAFLEDRGDWLVLPVLQSRDSGPIDESNFAAALTILGGESDTVEVHRFGHWGPGWIEVVLIAPSRKADAQEISDRLEAYPILDEDDASSREHDAYLESWDFWGRSEYWRAVIRGVGELSAGAEQILEDATSEEIDAFAESAKATVNWIYESSDEGVRINIRGLVEATDADAVIEFAEREAFAARRRDDIRKYCEAFGLPAHVIREAIRRNLDLMSQIAGVCDP